MKRSGGWAVGVAFAVTWSASGLLAQTSTTGATRVAAPPTVDGVLDEAFWGTIDPITDFKQRDPVDGAPPSERTEVRIAYDANGIYFGLRLFDSEPHLIRRSILHRGGRIDKDDRVVIALDTYHDRRSAYVFEFGALGTQDDALFTDEHMVLDDWAWDGVFESETSFDEDGWVLEVAIPFTTIRFSEDAAPEMGIAFQRSIRRKNENVYWPHIGQEYREGIAQVSRYATLTGLADLHRGRYIEMKPFAIAGAQKAGAADTDFTRSTGVDVKYAITSNLALDLTWNTDFAQVESDDVQVNLTRFNIFFPEKREFFLERSALFQFGAPRETEVFFSRSIGLNDDIRGGGRLTGQLGAVSLGALSLRTDEVTVNGEVIPAAWNSVARVRADVLPRGSVGAIVASKESEDFHNRTAGVDFTTRFWSSSSLLLWAANVWDARHQEGDGGTSAAQAELVLRNADYMFELTRTEIGAAFQPALGFVPRPDQARWGGQFGVTPRFQSSDWARQLQLFVRANRIEGQNGVKQSHFRRVDGAFSFESGERAGIEWSEQFERLEVPARIQGRTLPAGDYAFRYLSGSLGTNDSRTLSGNANWQVGDFWSGTRTRLGGGLTWKTGPHLSLGTSLSRNAVSLPVEDGDFTATVVGLDIQGALSRRLFANALVQWDDISRTLQANVRVDWIHTPGSDLFLVINTGYRTGDLLDPLAERWIRRTGVVKLTYLKAL